MGQNAEVGKVSSIMWPHLIRKSHPRCHLILAKSEIKAINSGSKERAEKSIELTKKKRSNANRTKTTIKTPKCKSLKNRYQMRFHRAFKEL